MMYEITARLLVSVGAILLAAYVVPGVTVAGFGTALLAAVVLGAINLIVKPLLFILTLPVTLITFGLFSFVLNALLLWFAASLIPGFSIESFIAAFLGSFLIAGVQWIGHRLLFL
jgi:putative membrane protein